MTKNKRRGDNTKTPKEKRKKERPQDGQRVKNMTKYEIKAEELKKEFDDTEADALAGALLFNKYIIITRGADFSDLVKARRAKREGTAEAAGDLYGLPYISNSVNNEGAALWNTNTSAELAGFDGFKFLGVSISNAGEFVGLFQAHNDQGEEVSGVRCLLLDKLGEFIAHNQKKEHEATKAAQLERINKEREEIRERLPQVCAIFEKYRGKRWGEATRRAILDQLKELNGETIRPSFSTSAYWLDIEFYKRNSYTSAAAFSYKWDASNNTPAEAITPRAADLEKVAHIAIKDHRRKMRDLVQEMETTAAKLAQLIDQYNEEARGKGYKMADNLSKWGVKLPEITARDLDQ